MLKSDFLTRYNAVSRWFSNIDEDLCIYNAVVEEPNNEVISFLKTIISSELDDPNIAFFYGTENEYHIDYDELDDSDACDNGSWRISLNKRKIAENLSDLEANLSFFFSKDSFLPFLEGLDPFQGNSHQFDNDTRLFLVNELEQPIGGEHFYAVGHKENFPSLVVDLPSSDDVHKLVHVNSTKPFRVCPRSLSLNQAGSNLAYIPKLKRNVAKLLAACLVQEIKVLDSREEVTIKGSKKQITILSDNSEEPSDRLLTLLHKTVVWVYEERSETRLQLLMDRLSLDMSDEESYLTALESYLERALEQARDSYAFVILDRKDDYHKEVRDLIKDMRSQADLYATKTRSLVNSLARDILGVLVFFSFSFMSRVQRIDMDTLLTNEIMTLILYVISAYLTVSMILQLIVHIRDDYLTKEENEQWLGILQNYTKTEDQKKNFLEPIKARRKTFYVTAFLIVALYIVVIYIIYNLQCILPKIL